MSFNLNSRIVDLVAPRARCRSGDAEICGQPAPGRQNQPDSTARRQLLGALAGLPLLGLSGPAQADPLAGLRRWGQGEYRRFGLLIYEATLWAGDDPLRPPLALRLDYHRTISGQTIAEASVSEMRAMLGDDPRLALWGERMRRVFPDVRPGEHLLGVQQAEAAAFYQAGRLLGRIDAPGFADAFFGIWLDARTSAPGLRAALLKG